MFVENRYDVHMVQKSNFLTETVANKLQIDSRSMLSDKFLNNSLPQEDLLSNLGLFVRSGLLSKILVLNDVYQRIKNVPGILIEFGVWWGQNLVLLENLRAIHEPFNKNRKIVGFDTFEGYRNFSSVDKESEVFAETSYSTGLGYKAELESLLRIHESMNVLGNVNGVHELIAGDVSDTVPNYFKQNSNQIVAFAYFDMGLYKPTKVALASLVPHLVPGSVLLFDELTWTEAPGEAIAFKEVVKDFGLKYKIEKVESYPSKTLVTIL